MNELKIFENSEFGRMRTMATDGEMWFCGSDVAEALGYKNTKDALATHVDEEDKRIFQRSEIATLENHIPKSALPVDFVSAEIPNRGMTFINESGLYALVLSSKLPGAKRFKRWVTSEVLPTIRKTGSYGGVNLSNLSPELQVLINLEQRQKEQQKAIEDVNQRLDGIREIMCIHPDNWRRDCRKLLSKIAIDQGGLEAYPDINNEAFELVELRGHCNLNRRLVNQKNRMREAGATLKALKEMNRVDVIADDPRLTEIYIAVVKELAVKYGVK